MQVYRIFRREGAAAPAMRSVVIALAIAAALVTTVAIVRVAHQHEVLRLGYDLSHQTEYVRRLHDDRRRLELEHATLSSPDRIRRLATRLGMTQVSPDRVRIVRRRQHTSPGLAQR